MFVFLRCVAITLWCCVAITLWLCVAITLRRCVAIAIFSFSLCCNHNLASYRSHSFALCRNRPCRNRFLTSLCRNHTLALCHTHSLALCRNRHLFVSQSLFGVVSQSTFRNRHFLHAHKCLPIGRGISARRGRGSFFIAAQRARSYAAARANGARSERLPCPLCARLGTCVRVRVVTSL